MHTAIVYAQLVTKNLSHAENERTTADRNAIWFRKLYFHNVKYAADVVAEFKDKDTYNGHVWLTLILALMDVLEL